MKEGGGGCMPFMGKLISPVKFLLFFLSCYKVFFLTLSAFHSLGLKVFKSNIGITRDYSFLKSYFPMFVNVKFKFPGWRPI